MAKVNKDTKTTKVSTNHNTRWVDDDDFEKDLYSISEFAQFFKNPSPPSVYVRKARTKSVFDDDDFDHENDVPNSCGRGRGLNINRKTPSGLAFLKQQSETSQEIRLTSSGYGFCNDQIEHALNCDTAAPRLSVQSTPSSGTNARASPSKVASTPLLPLCDIVRNGTKVKKQQLPKSDLNKADRNKSDHDKSVDINSLKDFPKLS